MRTSEAMRSACTVRWHVQSTHEGICVGSAHLGHTAQLCLLRLCTWAYPGQSRAVQESGRAALLSSQAHHPPALSHLWGKSDSVTAFLLAALRFESSAVA